MSDKEDFAEFGYDGVVSMTPAGNLVVRVGHDVVVVQRADIVDFLSGVKDVLHL